MKYSKKIAMITGVILFNSISAQAMVVHDPANFFQNRITAMNSVKSLLEQIKSVKYQLNMYKNDLKNMRVLAQHVWPNSGQDLQKLIHIHMQGNVPSYLAENPREDFQRKFSYDKGADLYEINKNMSNTVFDVVKNSFAGASTQAKEFSDESFINKKLHALSAKSQGQMEALQTANLFAGMQIAQLQKLRELVINQINVQANQLAYQINHEKARNAALSQWLQSSVKDIPSYGVGKGFGPEHVSLS